MVSTVNMEDCIHLERTLLMPNDVSLMQVRGTQLLQFTLITLLLLLMFSLRSRLVSFLLRHFSVERARDNSFLRRNHARIYDYNNHGSIFILFLLIH